MRTYLSVSATIYKTGYFARMPDFLARCVGSVAIEQFVCGLKKNY
jgi:hypothetical protein